MHWINQHQTILYSRLTNYLFDLSSDADNFVTFLCIHVNLFNISRSLAGNQFAHVVKKRQLVYEQTTLHDVINRLNV